MRKPYDPFLRVLVKRPGLPLRAMNSYLYSIYAAGYAAGLSDAGGEKLRGAVQEITGQIEKLLKNRKEKDAP